MECFSDGDSLLDAFSVNIPDIVILDVMMPGRDGFSICSQIRKSSFVPIILLTARDSDADYIAGFYSGCDDYFTKPFSPVKLVLRIKNILSKHNTHDEELHFGDLHLVPAQRSTACKGQEVHLTATEFGLPNCLMQKSSCAVAREELLDTVWGYDSEVETRAVDDCVKRLRKKLAEHLSDVLVETVWGFGFKLSKKAEEAHV